MLPTHTHTQRERERERESQRERRERETEREGGRGGRRVEEEKRDHTPAYRYLRSREFRC